MSRILTYCIVAADCLTDLEITLQRNLEVNRFLSDRVCFDLAISDQDGSFFDTIVDTYRKDIIDEYLTVRRLSNSTESAKAKNTFRDLIKTPLYSQVGKNNFVSADETQMILRLYELYGHDMTIDHFSGVAGDGTSQRITVGADLYREVGYDTKLLPQQSDEIGLLLTILREKQGIPYITYFPGGGLLADGPIAEFLNEENISINNIISDRPTSRLSLPPNIVAMNHPENLVISLRIAQYNRLSLFAKLTRDPEKKSKYLDHAKQAGDDLLDVYNSTESPNLFIEPHNGSIERCSPDHVPVFASVKDDEWLLPAWYAHYRALGFGPFVLVDDNSRVPVEEILPYADVHVVRPRAGGFRSSKTLWLREAMATCVTEGQWVLTVDADEFLDIPASLAGLLGRAEANRQALLVGMLVDMLPNSSFVAEPHRLSPADTLSVFNQRLAAGGRSNEYASHKAIRWAFGRHWKRSFEIDARYHLFGNVDVLRKVPLFRFRQRIRLHQGFHALFVGDKNINIKRHFKNGILPIRHYKLVKLFDEDLRLGISRYAQQDHVYHDRTKNNLARMVAFSGSELRSKVRALRTVEYNKFLFESPITRCRRRIISILERS